VINADITRKIVGNCSHSLPVVVSCLECAKIELEKWEKRIRQDHEHIGYDEVRQLRETLAKSRDETRKLQETNDTLISEYTKIQKQNVALAEQLKVTKEQAAGYGAQLHAEAVQKTYEKYPHAVESVE